MTRLEALLSDLRETLGSPSPSRSSAAWKGFYGDMGQALAPGNRDNAQPFPYRTQTAEVVWAEVRKLVPKHPELDEKQVLQLAIENTGVSPLDLTPEDWRLLEMAIEWFKNGTTGIPKPRIGGAPGGPFDPREYGHTLSKRGAP